MYYTLIASLQPFVLKSESGTTSQSAGLLELKGEVLDALVPKDKEVVQVLYTFYDIENLLGQISGSNIPHNPLGNLSEEEIAGEIENAIDPEDDEPFVSRFPTSVRYALDLIKSRAEVEEDDPAAKSEYSIRDAEKLLLSNFYTQCAGSKNKYLKKWGEIDYAMRRTAAGEVSEQESRDLQEEWWYTELQGVIAERDFVRREHRMDELRWNIAEVLIEPAGVDGFTHEFDLCGVLSYLTKLNILQRWGNLSKEEGRQRFEEVVSGFTQKGEIEL